MRYGLGDISINRDGSYFDEFVSALFVLSVYIFWELLLKTGFMLER